MTTVKDLKKLFDNLETNINQKIANLEDELKKDNADLKKKNDDNTIIIQEDILQIRNTVILRLSTDNETLRSRVKTLEERLVKVERTMNLNQQNSRKNNLEIHGLPDNIQQTNLKSQIVKIVNALDIRCGEDDIEACHRLKSKFSPKPTIIRARRNLLEKIVDKRKEVNNIVTAVGLPQDTKIYVTNNLCPHMKSLAYECRLLKQKNRIKDTWSFNGVLKIKRLNDDIIKISHEVDLFKLFPDFVDFSFNKIFCQTAMVEQDDDE